MIWLARLDAPNDKSSRRYLWTEENDTVSILMYNKIGYFCGGQKLRKVDARMNWKEHRKRGWNVNFRKRDASRNATTAIQLEILRIKRDANDLAG